MSLILSVVGFVLAIGILVTVHELGHYLAARLCGVRVLRFSIGFGAPLFRRRLGRDGTEYRLGAVPLGGYVQMLDEREGGVDESERHRSYNRQSIPRRALILLAGPGFNFLFAILAYAVIFTAGVPGLKPVLGEVAAETPAAEAGLQSGDEILSVNGAATATWRQAGIELLDGLLEADRIELTVRRDSREESVALRIAPERRTALTEPGALLPGLGFEPWMPTLPPVIGDLMPDGAAVEGGLATGDRVVAVEGQAVESWDDFREAVASRPDQPTRIEVRRAGRLESLTVTPRPVDGEAGGETRGRIGAAPRVPDDFAASMRAEERYGPVSALGRAVANTGEMSALTLRMLYRMVTGEVSLRNLSGPINIAQYAGITVSSGLVSFLGFLAIVSISLGIVNLFPIPVLDGGQLVFLAVEGAIGRPVPERVLEIGQVVGLIMIAGLISFALYNDLMRLFG